jgi:ABC-type glutathione transport system ATPase component
MHMGEVSAKQDDVVLSVKDLTVGFGSNIVLDELNLDIYRGEILGFVGASGTGKSVLMRTVLRLLPPPLRRDPHFRRGFRQGNGGGAAEARHEARRALPARRAVFSADGQGKTSRCRCANISICRKR